MPRPAFAGPTDERSGDPGTPHDARCATSPYRAVPTRILAAGLQGRRGDPRRPWGSLPTSPPRDTRHSPGPIRVRIRLDHWS